VIVDLRTRLLNPETIRKLGRIEIKARHVVEGFLAGLHRSPYRGFSVEFAEHRSYVPGDDTRHIDWKVYGKRERYYIKQYHEETNFVATLLLDASESMTYASDARSKLDYALEAAAAISYLVLRQHDAVALGVYDRECTTYLPPATRLPFLARLSDTLSQVVPTGKTNTGRSLSQFSRQITRKGILVVISDFLDRPESILEGLRQLRCRGHEVVALHVLDPHELEFPLRGQARFEGLEATGRAFIEPHRLRDAYLEILNEHLHELRQGCGRVGIDYRLVNTAAPLDEFLLSYLTARMRQRRVAR
jgi:uncharacterized protein (DUF58 family)